MFSVLFFNNGKRRKNSITFSWRPIRQPSDTHSKWKRSWGIFFLLPCEMWQFLVVSAAAVTVQEVDGRDAQLHDSLQSKSQRVRALRRRTRPLQVCDCSACGHWANCWKTKHIPKNCPFQFIVFVFSSTSDDKEFSSLPAGLTYLQLRLLLISRFWTAGLDSEILEKVTNNKQNFVNECIPGPVHVFNVNLKFLFAQRSLLSKGSRKTMILVLSLSKMISVNLI